MTLTMWLAAAVTDTVSVPITHPGLLTVAVLLQVQNCSLLLGPDPSIWDKSSDIKIWQWGRPWLVWYVPCKRRCVPRFTKLKHRHHHCNDRRWRCETSLSRNSVTVSRWTARRYFHCLRRTITRITEKLQLNVLLQSLASIPQMYQSISINISD